MRPAPKPSEKYIRAKRAIERKERRAEYAAMAMQGLLASWGQHDVTDYDEIAQDAVMAADALLRELER